MAEAFFNKLAISRMSSGDDAYHASSAGIYAYDGGPASRHAVETLDFEHDIDISDHISQTVNAEIMRDAFLVLTMTPDQRDTLKANYPEHEGKIFTLKDYIDESQKDGTISDPFGSDERVYADVAAEIKHHVLRLIQKLNGRHKH